MSDLMKALIQAKKLRYNNIDDEKYSEGIYDYALQSYEHYKLYYSDKKTIQKLDKIDDHIIEILYFLLDEFLDTMIKEEMIWKI